MFASQRSPPKYAAPGEGFDPFDEGDIIAPSQSYELARVGSRPERPLYIKSVRKSTSDYAIDFLLAAMATIVASLIVVAINSLFSKKKKPEP